MAVFVFRLMLNYLVCFKSDASILKGTDGGSKEDSFFGKMWSSLWNSNGGDTSATTD